MGISTGLSYLENSFVGFPKPVFNTTFVNENINIYHNIW